MQQPGDQQSHRALPGHREELRLRHSFGTRRRVTFASDQPVSLSGLEMPPRAALAPAAALAGDASRPDARASRADLRVADVLYRTALAGDRRAAVITVLSAIFVTSLVEQPRSSQVAWVWCVACVLIAGARLL